MPVSVGVCEKRSCRASNPPAEAPMPTTGKVSLACTGAPLACTPAARSREECGAVSGRMLRLFGNSASLDFRRLVILPFGTCLDRGICNNPAFHVPSGYDLYLKHELINPKN